MIATRNGGNGQIKIIGVPVEEMKKNETMHNDIKQNFPQVKEFSLEINRTLQGECL